MSKKYYVGLDVSTQSTKLLLLDYEKESPAFVTSVNYDSDLPEFNTHGGAIKGLGEGVSESDPKMWIKAVRMVFDRVKGEGIDMSAISAISVSGQQHGLVCLDPEGNLTRKTSKLWNDVSTYPECEEMTAAAGGTGAMIEEVKNAMRPGYTASKIMQFKKSDPDAYAKTNTFFLVHNYINWFLTGGKHGGVRVMEPGDTSGIALWNPIKRAWSKKICESISHDLADKFPPVRSSAKFIGKLSNQLCRDYGFTSHCMVDAGSGDNMYGAVGTGNVRPGIVTISLGTSGTAYTVLKEPYVDEDGEIASFCDSFGNFLPLLCVSNLANGYNSFLEINDMSHDDFSKLIKKTQPGNDGKILLPWFGGERTPDLPNGAPVLFGFGLNGFSKENLCRAVLEGHIMNLYEGYLKLPTKADTIHLTGGLSKSNAWRQTIADIFNVTVVPVKGEGAALGAAIHAAYVDNMKDAGEVNEFINGFIEFEDKKKARPIKENSIKYQAFKDIYINLSRRVRGLSSDQDPFRARARFQA